MANFESYSWASDSTGKRPSLPRRKSVFAGVATFLLLFTLTSAFIYQRYLLVKAEQKEDALEFANKVKTNLNESVTNSLAAAKMLASFLAFNNDIERFDSIVGQFVGSTNFFESAQIFRDSILKYEFPHAVAELPSQNINNLSPASRISALNARKLNRSFFVCPLVLADGVKGMASYHPVFKDTGFWGYVGVVSNLNTVLFNSGIDSGGRSGYFFNITVTNKRTGIESVIMHSDRPLSYAQEVNLDVPNGHWHISVVPGSRYMGAADLWILFGLAAILSALGGILIYNIVQRPQWLNFLVKQRTKQLIENEENYRTLFEKNPLPLWIYDKESLHFLEVNEAAREFYGYSEGEFKVMTLLDIRAPEDADKFRKQVNRNSGTDLREAGIWTHFKKNREQVRVFIFSRNIQYRGGEAKLVLLLDVSEKVKVEQELKRSEEKYRMLINQASDGIILYSFDGRIQSFNYAACELSGYSEEEFSRINLHQLFIGNKPVPEKGEDHPLEQGRGTTIYRWLKRKDGAELIVELNARLLDDGKILAIIRDITEREEMLSQLKASEEKFATAFHSSAMIFSIVDDEGRIIDANDAYRKLLELKEDVIGKTSLEAGLLRHTSPEIRQTHFQNIRNLLDKNGRIEKYELHLKDSYENNKIIFLSMEPISLGGKRHWFMSAVDVTSDKLREEQIEAFNERFSLIAAATKEVIWDHDFISNKTWGNNKLYEMYGYDPGEGIEINLESFTSHLHPDDKMGVIKRMYESIESKKGHVTEFFRFRMPDGSYRRFHDRAILKYDENGQAIRIMGSMQDITDEENIKNLLVKEKEISDSIINSLPGIFYLVGSDYRFIRWNKNFETITGYSAAELASLRPINLVPEKYHEGVRHIMDKSMKGAYQQIEVELLCKDGSLIPYFFNGQPIFYENQNCVMGIGLDQSEQQRSQQKIVESEKRYRELIEQASDAIIITTVDGNYVEVNSSACKLLGYSKEEFLSMNASKVVTTVTNITELRNKIENIRDTGESVINEVLLRRKDGTLVPVETHSKRLPGGGLIAFVRDLSERKKADKQIRESEERYRSLVENATEALLLYDIESQVFVNVSESACRLFKLTAEALLNSGFKGISPEFQKDASSEEIFEEKLQMALAGDKVNYEWNYLDSNGKNIPCETWLVRLPGPRVLIRASIQDISERKKYERELKSTSQKLRELYNALQNVREEERKHIAREIHDELGQQLTGLKMDMYSIYRGINADDSGVREKLQDILKLIDQTMGSVRKIAMELRPSILDDLGLLAALEWQAEEFEKRSLMKVNFRSAVGDIRIQPDTATALFRVFQELLTNVGRHSEASEVNVDVNIEGSDLFLKVDDNGIGFEPERVEVKRTLGLTGIKERINLIHGTYSILSGLGKGTRVIVSVPLLEKI